MQKEYLSELKEIIGDILTPNTESTSVIVCQQVNCMGVMGAGLAKQVRNRFPGVFRAYKEKCDDIAAGLSEGLGEVLFVNVVADTGYTIANIFGQHEYGHKKQYTDYKALERAFEILATQSTASTTIRIPKGMGCGLGGGDWNEVFRLITEQLVDRGVKVEIWSLEDAQGRKHE